MNPAESSAASVRSIVDLAERLALENLDRVLTTFRRVRLSAADLEGSAGYGYGDTGREKLEAAFAELMGTESALVRPQLVSGTQALATMLKAVVEPGQHLILAGPVYDTLKPLLDPRATAPSSLHIRGVKITPIPVDEPGLNRQALTQALAQDPDWVYIQRSRGYQRRPSWGQDYCRELIRDAHAAGARTLVDNCYGEFTDVEEPGHWGADLLAGSLLKNPGGGLAPTGGYVAGRQHLIKRVADELYAPGLGGEVGPTGPYLRLFWQGLFYAPHAVSEALIGAALASEILEDAGLTVDPRPTSWPRQDIITAVTFPDCASLLAACRAVQEVSPIDSYVVPEPWQMPGYPEPVVMAAGGFVPGGSLELSADAPMRSPWQLFLQGGVMRQHTILAARRIVNAWQSRRSTPDE